MSLEDGIKALQQQQFSEAVDLLENYCKRPINKNTPTYIQAQMALARAYRGNNQREQAFALGQALQKHPDPQVNEWAKGFVSILIVEEKASNGPCSSGILVEPKKPLRTPEPGVRLPLPKASFHLGLAFYLTALVIVTIVFALDFTFISLINKNTVDQLIFAFALTLIFSLTIFLISPLIIDSIQKKFYKIQWINSSQIRKISPETANLIARVCRKHQINTPRLGLIDDGNPIIFTYGILPNQARIVITKGLLKYLKEEEIAAVYAHELGHIFQWNLALMTMGTSLSQITYLIFLFSKNLKSKNPKINQFYNGFKIISIIPYLIYHFINYLMYYLSRNREYFADHFAAEATGNPNGLSRALIKIAYGLLEEQKQATPLTLMALTRLLSICDPKAALIPGTAYFLTSDFQQVGQTFLWDLCNPWRLWIGLNSSHPLTGRRIHTLMNYSQLLELENQFNTIAVIIQGNQLNHRKLYGNFVLEILIFNAQWLGMIVGFIIGFLLREHIGIGIGTVSLGVLGFGGGLLIKILKMYPKIQNPPQTDIYSLMCDPYASPLTGYPIQLQGKLIGQEQPVYELGSTIILQDPSGIIFSRYSSPFSTLGNLFLSWAKIKNFLGSEVNLVGWFRRSVYPWIEWSQMTNFTFQKRNYPRFWSLIRGGGIIIVGLVMLIYAIVTHRLTAG